MPFAPSNYAYCPPAAPCVTIAESTNGQVRGRLESEVLRSTMNELRVGGVNYPLRRPCLTTFVPGAKEFFVEGFSPLFVGHGTTPKAAREDWLLTVHAAFQELSSLRPFEMTPRDELRWKVLSSRIDVTVYRNQTPIQIRQFGIVSKARPHPVQVQWENGQREAIRLKQVSPEFVTYKAGQPFEAIVSRDPLTFQLLRIVHIERRPTPARLSNAEEAELLASIGSSKILPVAEWT